MISQCVIRMVEKWCCGKTLFTEQLIRVQNIHSWKFIKKHHSIKELSTEFFNFSPKNNYFQTQKCRNTNHGRHAHHKNIQQKNSKTWVVHEILRIQTKEEVDHDWWKTRKCTEPKTIIRLLLKQIKRIK